MRNDTELFDAWFAAIPENIYDPCPCGCSKKFKFALAEDEAQFQKDGDTIHEKKFYQDKIAEIIVDEILAGR